VLADTRRLSDCFPALDYFEKFDLPFIVAVNCFEGARRFAETEVRMALDLEHSVPLIMCDARQRTSAKLVLLELVSHAMALARTARAKGAPVPHS